ncbi:alpha/beta hydrolase [Streptococcus caprae]|uniref:Alpha/beta hydrolase n=1 Tax=Streptococcus caprae TaxID=1640501 RepID=A0ABV8CUV9_9STRE
MFTLEHSVNDILANNIIMSHFEYLMPVFFLELVPEELRHLPLKEVRHQVIMPWGVPYVADDVIEGANQLINLSQDSENYEFIKVWSEETPEDYFPASDGARDGVGLLLIKQSFKPGRKLALICPGGGYSAVSMLNEGIHTAKILVEKEYAVAILNYRCSPNRYPLPQEDLALAIKRLKLLARERGVTSELLTIGFSAGGHLVASESCYHKEIEESLQKKLDKEFPGLAENLRDISAKSDMTCLSYPVISFLSEHHEDSFINLTGNDEILREKLSIEKNVTADFPKTFVWACQDDQLVLASNAERMYQALQRISVDVSYRLYPTGGHGIATAEGTSAEGWLNELVEYMSIEDEKIFSRI